MTEPGDGSFIADKGWPARKLYLSPEAIAMMENHCKGTPLTMSAYVDMLIKRDLLPKQRVEPGEFEVALPKRPGGPVDNRPVVPPVVHADIRTEKKQPTKKDFEIDV